MSEHRLGTLTVKAREVIEEVVRSVPARPLERGGGIGSMAMSLPTRRQEGDIFECVFHSFIGSERVTKERQIPIEFAVCWGRPREALDQVWKPADH